MHHLRMAGTRRALPRMLGVWPNRTHPPPVPDFKLPVVRAIGDGPSPRSGPLRHYVPLEVQGVSVCFFVDTGADSTIISEDWWTRFGAGELSTPTRRLIGPTGTTMPCSGEIEVHLRVAGYNMKTSVLVVPGLRESGILGMDVIDGTAAVIDYGNRTFRTARGEVQLC